MKHIKSISALMMLPCILAVPSHSAVAHPGNRRLRGTVLPSIGNANDKRLLEREGSVAVPGWVWAMKGRMELSRGLDGVEEDGKKVEDSSAKVPAAVEPLEADKYIYPPNDQAYTGISGPLSDGRIATTVGCDQQPGVQC